MSPPLVLSSQKHALLKVRRRLVIQTRALLGPKHSCSFLRLIRKILIDKFSTSLPRKFWCKIRRVGFSLRAKKVTKVGSRISLSSLVMRFRCRNRSRITISDKKLLSLSRSRFYKKPGASLSLVAFSNRILLQLHLLSICRW